MDWPLRTRLLIALVGIVTLWDPLTILTGRFLMNRMVGGGERARKRLGFHGMVVLQALPSLFWQGYGI